MNQNEEILHFYAYRFDNRLVTEFDVVRDRPEIVKSTDNPLQFRNEFISCTEIDLTKILRYESK